MECRACGAELPEGSEGGPCPLCGADRVPRPEPVAVREGWGFLPGIAFAVLVGLINWGVIVWSGFDMGIMLYVGLPLSIGTMLGYTVTVRGALKSFTLALLIVGALAALGATFGLAGFFCVLFLSAVFLLPIFVGILLGSVLRHAVARCAPVVLVLAFLPMTGAAVETALSDEPAVTVVTSERRVEAKAAVVWGHVVFFEEGEAEPPWIFRLGLPRPLRAEGSKARVGDESVCVYSRGHLKKRITERVEGRRLAFVVTEQDLHFERDVLLLGGVIEVIPEGEKACRLRLTTRYQGLVSPDWLWRPLEAWCLHELHDYVIDEIARRAAKAASLAAR